MKYLDGEGDIYNVSIEGLPVTKRPGDSFFWKGILAPGVVSEYSLRISTGNNSSELRATGPVAITILNPVPVELANANPTSENYLQFGNIAVDYTIPIGGIIPGTTLIFAAVTDQGAQ